MTGRPYGHVVLVISRCRQTIETAQQLSDNDKDIAPSATASLASATAAEHLQLKLHRRKL